MTSMGRGLRKAGLLASSLLLVQACSAPDPVSMPSPEPEPTTTTVSPTPTPRPTARVDNTMAREVPLLWQLQTTPVSDVANVAGRAVLMVSVKDGLEVQALDLSTGAVQWAHRVTSSLVAPQTAMPVTTLRNRYIAILEPLRGTDGRARLRLLDIEQQGKAVAGSGVYIFTSFPERCLDDSSMVCAKAVKGSRSVEVRVGPRGAATERAMPDEGDSYQDLGAHGLVRFLDPKTRKASIGVEKGGKLLWSRPERDVFGRLSPEAGWTFRAQGTVIYGTVMLPRATIADPLPQRYLTLALDRRNGSTLWKMPGADLACSSRRDVDLLCEWQAGLVRRDGSVEQGRMVVHRLNARTGEKIWSTRPIFVRAPDAGQLGTSGEGVVATESGGRLWIDAVTGHMRPAQPADVTWRRVAVQVPSDQVSFRGSTKVTTRRAVVNQNAPVNAPERFYAPLPPGTGARFDMTQVVSLPGRVVALDLA
ncbi:hypothetical protein ACTQ49_04925 [Luteococcus sp. Sow4_B9]|uniref:hypothetical protein n=1 Tax=Luteococcus sp. Sow4_B9 TaxID=3438792 RepID=UPI003F955252